MVLSNGSIGTEGFRFARGFIRLSCLVGFVMLVVLYGIHFMGMTMLGSCAICLFLPFCACTRVRARGSVSVCVCVSGVLCPKPYKLNPKPYTIPIIP